MLAFGETPLDPRRRQHDMPIEEVSTRGNQILATNQPISPNGSARAIQQSTHQMPPPPSNAEKSPRMLKNAMAVGQRQMRHGEFSLFTTSILPSESAFARRHWDNIKIDSPEIQPWSVSYLLGIVMRGPDRKR